MALIITREEKILLSYLHLKEFPKVFIYSYKMNFSYITDKETEIGPNM